MVKQLEEFDYDKIARLEAELEVQKNINAMMVDVKGTRSVIAVVDGHPVRDPHEVDGRFNRVGIKLGNSNGTERILYIPVRADAKVRVIVEEYK